MPYTLGYRATSKSTDSLTGKCLMDSFYLLYTGTFQDKADG